jgi:hypothetical protein
MCFRFAPNEGNGLSFIRSPVEITDKVNGEVTSTERRELSPDFKTLTRTVRPVGQRDPAVFVFERQ